MNIVEASKLCKSYGVHPVLHDVDLTIQKGKLVGFLGPNGAGKTTTLRILLGLLKQDSGNASLFGKSCQRHGKSIRSEVGYLPGDVHVYSNMTGKRLLEFLASARRRDCREEILRLSERFELPLDKTVRKFSTGMRQKLGLIQALMHRPDLLILDEPTSALDPLVRKIVFEELRKVIDDGRTVLFSSHSLNEVEQLCDEVIILRSGRVVEHQKIDVLKNRALRKVEMVFRSSVPESLPPSFRVIRQNQQSVLGTWTGEIADLLKWLDPDSLEDLIVERPDLNDLFLAYYSETTQGQGGRHV